MNIKTAVKYQISDSKKPLMIYYLIICTIMIISILAINTFDKSGNSSFGGLETSSMIFIFIAGLNSFKETFRMFLQNGRSRRTLFLSFVCSIIPICVIMALLDTVISIIGYSFSSYESAFMQLYSQKYIGNSSNVQSLFEGFLWYIFTFTFFSMLGYFISILYYRMNKALKLLISIGVPILFIIVLPIIDTTFTNGVISRGVINFFTFAFGFKNGFNPFYSMITFALFFGLFGSFSYLLMRKAIVKD